MECCGAVGPMDWSRSAYNGYQEQQHDLIQHICYKIFLTKKLNQLNLINMYLEAAKAKVEFCHEPLEGMQLFNYAVLLLNKMECRTCK